LPGPLLAASHGPTAFWYLTRGAGIIALVLLSAVIVLGVATSLGWTTERWPRFFSQNLHRDLSLFCLVLIVIHVVTTVIDGFAPIGFLDAVIPFRSPYRPLWLGFGALAFDLFVVLGVTSALRHRMGYRSWKLIHWLAYLCWPVAVLHGLGTGTDARLGPVLVLDAVCVTAVLGALGYRLAAGWPTHAGRRVLGGGAASAFCLALALFVVFGPLRPDWSKRAGTPTGLLSSGAPAAPAAPSTSQGAAEPSQPSASNGGTASLPTSPFEASLVGSFTTSAPDAAGQVTVDIRGQLTRGANLPFELVLHGTQEGDGVRLSSSQVTVGPGTGHIVALNGDQVVTLVRSGASSLSLTMHLGLDQASGRVQGTAQGTPGNSAGDAGGANQ
jgi:DMSO/TMAO reductase YedYZ heme-binding membrane subunit